MSWQVTLLFQRRGTKDEVSESVVFASRDEAVDAVLDLEARIDATTDPSALIVFEARSGRRLSFVKQDFLRTRVD